MAALRREVAPFAMLALACADLRDFAVALSGMAAKAVDVCCRGVKQTEVSVSFMSSSDPKLTVRLRAASTATFLIGDFRHKVAR